MDLQNMLEEEMKRLGFSKKALCAHIGNFSGIPIPYTTFMDWTRGGVPSKRYKRPLEEYLSIIFLADGSIQTVREIKENAKRNLYILIPLMEALRRHLELFVEGPPEARAEFKKEYIKRNWRLIGSLLTSLSDEAVLSRWLQFGGAQELNNGK